MTGFVQASSTGTSSKTLIEILDSDDNEASASHQLTYVDCVVTGFMQVSSTGTSPKNLKIMETSDSQDIIEILDSDDDEAGASHQLTCLLINDQLCRKHPSLPDP